MPTNSVNLATYKAVKASKAVGSATQPIYITSDGTFAACIQANGNANLWFESATDVLNQVKTSATAGDRFISWSVNGTTYAGAPGTANWYDIIAISPTSVGNGTTLLAKQYGSNYNLYVGYTWRNGETQPQWKQIVLGDGTGASGTWGINISGSAGTLAHKLFGSTSNIDSTAGSFAFSGDNNYWSGCDWVGLQIGDSVDKWQIVADANTLCFRQNDSGGANATWQSWVRFITDSTEQTISGVKHFTGNLWWGTSNQGGYLNGAATNGGVNSIRIGDDVWLGDCNAGGMMGMKSTGNNCGFYFYNSAGTLIGYFQSINGSYFQTDRKFYIPNTASSWIDGQRYQNAAINIHTINNTGSYFPWVNQINNGSARWFSFGILNQAFYLMGSATSRTSNGYDYGLSFNVVNGYLQGASRVYSAVWNDYAEFRKADIDTPGYVVVPSITGVATLATERLQAGGRVISDTYGNAVGQCDEAQTPVGLAGRVLAYPYRDKSEYNIGDAVCTAPNGTVDIMTREEICRYPDRILGIVNEIPTYEVWKQTFTDSEGATQQTHSVEVKGRIWIDIK